MNRKTMESTRSRRVKSNETVIMDTPKFYLAKDKRGTIIGEASHSKVAPTYLTNLIDAPKSDEEDEDDQDQTTSESFDSSCSKSYELLEDWKKNVQDDERLSRIYQLRHSFSLRFDNRAWLHPHGTTNFDYKGIPEGKKEGFEKFKNQVRQENYLYLRNHPEIQGIISLAMKKLLHAEPEDPVKYLTEYFTTVTKRSKEFEDNVKIETDKISFYHMKKMRDAGQINLKPCTAVRSEASGEYWGPEVDANYSKKLNIGALAKDFCFIDSCVQEKKKKSEDIKIKKSKKKQRKYCGCKDWKLKKNRRSAVTEEHEEMENTQTFSTLGNLKDDLLTTSAEDEEEGDDDEEEMNIGDGQFFGEMTEEAGETHEMTQEEAQKIANKMVQEMLLLT